MDCPKCKTGMRLTATLNEDDKVAMQYFRCDSCGEQYVSVGGKKPAIVAALQKSDSLLAAEKAAEERKAIQREKAKGYRLAREARLAAEKAKEDEELMAIINAPVVKAANADLAPLVIDRTAPVVVVKPKKTEVAKKTGPLTDEEKKARARKWARESYHRRKNKTN